MMLHERYRRVAEVGERALVHALTTSTPPPEAAREVLRAVSEGRVLELSDAELAAARCAFCEEYDRDLRVFFEESYDYTAEPLYRLARKVAEEFGLEVVEERFEWLYDPESTRAYEPPEPWLRLYVRGERASEVTGALCDRWAESEMGIDGLAVLFLSV